jgi:hypothetical protein
MSDAYGKGAERSPSRGCCSGKGPRPRLQVAEAQCRGDIKRGKCSKPAAWGVMAGFLDGPVITLTLLALPKVSVRRLKSMSHEWVTSGHANVVASSKVWCPSAGIAHAPCHYALATATSKRPVLLAPSEIAPDKGVLSMESQRSTFVVRAHGH